MIAWKLNEVKSTNCPIRMHIMSGCRSDEVLTSAMEKVYLENLQFSAKRLEKVSIAVGPIDR